MRQLPSQRALVALTKWSLPRYTRLLRPSHREPLLVQRFTSFKQQKQQQVIARPAAIPMAEIILSDNDDGTNHHPTEFARALAPHYQSQTPVVFRGYSKMNDCEAMRLWKDVDHLCRAVGEETPCWVEIGKSYSRDDSQRVEICFGDYIRYWKLFHRNDNNDSDSSDDRQPLVYLAQNQLFPGLQDDFTIPTLCQNDGYSGVGNGKLYDVMFWMGPCGCISPLHFDPLDNLLMQFAGRKRFLLYPPSTSQHDCYYYGGYEGQQYNTSPIRVQDEVIDRTKFPRFADAPAALECILSPGDLLYLPSKWWHHVRSLDSSISVNIWWR